MGTSNFLFGMFLCFSVSSREPLNAYAAMGLWGYRGVSGFYDPAIRLLSFLHRPGSALGTPNFSSACFFAFL